MTVASECARLLRIERELHGLTVAEAAARAGMDAAQLGEIERGRACCSKGPTTLTLVRILSAYPDADLEEFLLRLMRVAKDELAAAPAGDVGSWLSPHDEAQGAPEQDRTPEATTPPGGGDVEQ